jgi:hypothetical protein
VRGADGHSALRWLAHPRNSISVTATNPSTRALHAADLGSKCAEGHRAFCR